MTELEERFFFKAVIPSLSRDQTRLAKERRPTAYTISTFRHPERSQQAKSKDQPPQGFHIKTA
jgi:hypothetical protein